MATHTVRTIDIREFQKQCLALIDEVAEKRIEAIITKEGAPIARLIPWTKSAGHS